MKKGIKIMLMFCLCATFFSPIVAQTTKQPKSESKSASSTIFHVETNDGNDYDGQKISEDENIVKLNTSKLGEITIRKSDIKKIEIINDNRFLDGEYLFENPNSTRYLFAPSAYALKEGEGYYQNSSVIFNQVSMGFTDKLTIGVGTVPTFLFVKDGLEFTPFWITPKYSFGSQEKNINFAIGGIYMTFPFIDKNTFFNPGGFGILYGTGTVGNKDNNLSVGLGWGFNHKFGQLDQSEKRAQFGKTPTLNVSGMYRFSKRGYIVSENWLVSAGKESLAIVSAAYRFAGKNISVDLGAVSFVTGDFTEQPLVGPWLGVVIPFTTKDYARKSASTPKEKSVKSAKKFSWF